MSMTLLLPGAVAIGGGDSFWCADEAQLAAAAFLARYSGRTLEAYRHDHVAVLASPRPDLRVSRRVEADVGDMATVCVLGRQVATQMS